MLPWRHSGRLTMMCLARVVRRRLLLMEWQLPEVEVWRRRHRRRRRLSRASIRRAWAASLLLCLLLRL